MIILIAVLISLAQLEFSRLAEAKNLKIFTPLSIVASIVFAGTWYWRQFIEIPPMMYMALLSAFSLMGLLLYQYCRYGNSGVIANCGASYFSIIYLGLFSAFVLGIRIDLGLWPLVMFIFVIKSSDIGAYAIGSLFGKHKFSPKISPGKTWEGAEAGLIGAILVSLLFIPDTFLRLPFNGWWQAALLGLAVSVFGQLGDLAESLLKRNAGVKDSGSLVPGHGGFLDRIDSIVFAGIVVYYYVVWMIQ